MCKMYCLKAAQLPDFVDLYTYFGIVKIIRQYNNI